MSRIPWKSAIVAAVLVLALLWTLQAEAGERKPTALGLWAQYISATPRGIYFGCNIAPPYSTKCWETVPTKTGYRVVYYYAPPKGWTK